MRRCSAHVFARIWFIQAFAAPHLICRSSRLHGDKELPPCSMSSATHISSQLIDCSTALAAGVRGARLPKAPTRRSALSLLAHPRYLPRVLEQTAEKSLKKTVRPTERQKSKTVLTTDWFPNQLSREKPDRSPGFITESPS
jgi:hypothetical protein